MFISKYGKCSSHHAKQKLDLPAKMTFRKHYQSQSIFLLTLSFVVQLQKFHNYLFLSDAPKFTCSSIAKHHARRQLDSCKSQSNINKYMCVWTISPRQCSNAASGAPIVAVCCGHVIQLFGTCHVCVCVASQIVYSVSSALLSSSLDSLAKELAHGFATISFPNQCSLLSIYSYIYVQFRKVKFIKTNKK